MGKALVVAAIVIGVALVLVALAVVGRKLVEGPAVRRAELRRAQLRYLAAETALRDVRDQAEVWRDVDAPLAQAVREAFGRYEGELRKITK